ncbi:hypothetical protein [Enterococcus sp. AZ192]|uniref:hypothetical protein n=1 Tax=unclassified Enterococcus TaxID=2608891 RepID=UPI003D2A87A3
MISRNIIKISSVVIAIIAVLTFLFFISKDQLPIFFPNQQKEIKVKIADHNIEARIYIYLDEKHKEDFEITLYDNQLKENLAPYSVGKDKFTPKGKLHYVYIVEKGGAYTAIIKNKTDSVIISNIRVEDND